MFEAFDGSPKSFELLDRHLLVVGQSGSGKSYFIGKLIEQLVKKTRCRVVVLDRAGDFVKSGLSADEQSIMRFEATMYSQWRDGALLAGRLRRIRAKAFRNLAIHPYWFNPIDLSLALGFPRDHIFWGPIADVQRKLTNQGRYGFSDLCTALGKLEPRPTGIITRLDAGDFLTERLLSRPDSDKAYAKRQTQFTASENFKDGIPADTPEQIVEAPGLHVVDLSSLNNEHARFVLFLGVLRALLKSSRQQWWHKHLSIERRPRIPVFVIVDEAHHVCPAEQMESPIGMQVREALLEIAAEGRKYGLWLVCGTQRPTRLHPTILSETSNFMLMRTTSESDRCFLANHLSNKKLQKDLASLERGKGRGYLSGEWAADGYEAVKVSPREAAHIEGKFEVGEWVL